MSDFWLSLVPPVKKVFDREYFWFVRCSVFDLRRNIYDFIDKNLTWYNAKSFIAALYVAMNVAYNDEEKEKIRDSAEILNDLIKSKNIWIPYEAKMAIRYSMSYGNKWTDSYKYKKRMDSAMRNLRIHRGLLYH